MPHCQNFDFMKRSNHGKNSYERNVYEIADDKSLSQLISQNMTEKWFLAEMGYSKSNKEWFYFYLESYNNWINCQLFIFMLLCLLHRIFLCSYFFIILIIFLRKYTLATIYHTLIHNHYRLIVTYALYIVRMCLFVLTLEAIGILCLVYKNFVQMQ